MRNEEKDDNIFLSAQLTEDSNFVFGKLHNIAISWAAQANFT
jgi:hypothetical protein